MHQFCENDAQKLASLPLHFGEYKKVEVQQYIATLGTNLENYELPLHLKMYFKVYDQDLLLLLNSANIELFTLC